MATSPASGLEDALAALKRDLRTCQSLENALRGKGNCPEESRASGNKPTRKRPSPEAMPSPSVNSVETVLTAVVSACKQSRVDAVHDAGAPDDTSDAALAQYTRHTDGIALDVYSKFLHYVPRLVNVVTVRATRISVGSSRAPSPGARRKATAQSPAPSAQPPWP